MGLFRFASVASLAFVIAASFPAFAAGTEKDPYNNLPQLDTRYQSLETLARGLFYLETMYVDEAKVKPDDLATNALKGVIEKLDPHTVLMPKKAFEQLTIDTQGKFGGVGIIVSAEKDKAGGKDHLIVVSPIEDTPAYTAGVKSGDEIIAIDGVMIKSMKGNDAVDNMRGEPGSVLKLKIKREGTKEPLDFDLTREIIKVKSVRGQTLPQSHMVYARISSFQENTGEELDDLMKKEQKKGKFEGMVLDLRDNPGGLLDQAVRVVDEFIESGVIVSTVGRDRSRVEREFATKRGTFTNFPMVVLMNGGSASASEIVGGALQDHERALIMGTTSFGKGSVQTLVSLPDGSGLKLTVARYYTPKDRSIQAKGITPDIVVAAKNRPNRKGPSTGEPPAVEVSPEVKAKDDPNHERKESDLEGHITSDDLSDLAKESDINKTVKAWPAEMQSDNQLVTAFTYLKSYARFQAKAGKANSETPLPPKILENGAPVKPGAKGKDDGASNGKDGAPEQSDDGPEEK